MENKQEEYREVHYNVPQMLFYAVMASINVLIFGRATGKTVGPGALFSHHNLTQMPRSNGIFVNVSYEKLLTILIPGVIQGWELLGYQQDTHFWVKRFPPEKLKLPKALRYPLKPDHYIQWFNGSGIYLVSMDRPNLANGLSADWLYGDEARFLNFEKLTQILLCLRGNAEHFGHLSCHLSVLFTSDMPRTAEQKWMMQYRDQMDTETVELILSIQHRISELHALLQGEKAPATVQKIERKVRSYQEKLNELRKDLVYFGTASTFDNIHALGLKPIQQFKRLLSDLDFQTGVLNKEIKQIEEGFYPGYDETVHGYRASDYGHLDGLEFGRTAPEKDCLWDADVQLSEPLEIACDANAKINWIVTGQSYGDEYRVLSGFYVEHPERIKDLAAKWARYYRHHRSREVTFYYDHTFVAENPVNDLSFADEWANCLESLGWSVRKEYLGQTASHYSRYLFWGELLSGNNPYLPTFRMNLLNCEQLETSVTNCKVRQGKTGFEKDKRPERDPNYPAKDAPHGSDALDTLLYATQRHKLDYLQGGSFLDAAMM